MTSCTTMLWMVAYELTPSRSPFTSLSSELEVSRSGRRIRVSQFNPPSHQAIAKTRRGVTLCNLVPSLWRTAIPDPEVGCNWTYLTVSHCFPADQGPDLYTRPMRKHMSSQIIRSNVQWYGQRNRQQIGEGFKLSRGHNFCQPGPFKAPSLVFYQWCSADVASHCSSHPTCLVAPKSLLLASWDTGILTSAYAAAPFKFPLSRDQFSRGPHHLQQTPLACRSAITDPPGSPNRCGQCHFTSETLDNMGHDGRQGTFGSRACSCTGLVMEVATPLSPRSSLVSIWPQGWNSLVRSLAPFLACRLYLLTRHLRSSRTPFSAGQAGAVEQTIPSTPEKGLHTRLSTSGI